MIQVDLIAANLRRWSYYRRCLHHFYSMVISIRRQLIEEKQLT